MQIEKMAEITKFDTGNESAPDCQQDDDCQPKDLSFKSGSKKMKPIPPPLNLAVHSSPLKEFAIIATSPKSPLMQKNLPFRKRAYSLTGIQDTGQQINSTSSSSAQVPVEHPEQKSPLPSLNEETADSLRTSVAFTKHSAMLDSRIIYPGSPCWSPTLTTCSFLGPISPSHWVTGTSVVLSPAPSSLGSSREELNSGDSSRLQVFPSGHVNPWPNPVWHCFQAGVLLKIDLPHRGTVGAWKLAEELSKTAVPDWLGPLQVEEITELDGSYKIHFKCQEQWQGEVTAQCHVQHTFYIRDKGWCAICPDQVYKQYGVMCQRLEKNDICIPPARLPVTSPDICDRFKRFSFPPEDVGTPPVPSPSNLSSVPSPSDVFLSPPTSPNKKLKDADRPKRPMNAFMLFAKRYRLELIQMHPGKDNRAISVILGEAWRSLPPDEKEKYVAEARTMAQERKRLHPDCWKRKRSHSASFIESPPP